MSLSPQRKQVVATELGVLAFLLLVFVITSLTLWVVPTSAFLTAYTWNNLFQILGFYTGVASTVLIWGTSVFHIVSAIFFAINGIVPKEDKEQY